MIRIYKCSFISTQYTLSETWPLLAIKGTYYMKSLCHHTVSNDYC